MDQVITKDMCAILATPEAECFVRDVSSEDPAKIKRKLFRIPATATAQRLKTLIGNMFNYPPDSFELYLQKSNEFLNIHERTNEQLSEIGFGRRNKLTLFTKKNKAKDNFNSDAPELKDIADEMETVTIQGSSVPNSSFTFSYASTDSNQFTSLGTVPALEWDPSKDDIASSSSAGTVPALEWAPSKDDTASFPSGRAGFVGLVNQAMTCYLNSLLQTLFMTPEFRNTLYRWEFDGSEDEGSKSIPYQLQRLFLQLQTSNKAAVGTTALTTSFGWDSSEAWQQHDVQELCRVMFDALEQKFKYTSQADLISRLYEGKLKDYVKCLECGYESAREDTFLDVPLVVRPFGSSQAYASVGEALQAFVTPEILQESNQYFCEHCNKKCDAHKGLKFTKFPYLLTLQLKRFDFDPVTMHRIKLNDRVSFPEIFNLNDFIKSESSPEACDDGDTTDSGSALDDEGIGYASGYKTGCSLSPEAFSDTDLPDDDEGIDVGPHGPSLENNHELCINERNLKKSMEKGPYVYELFSIMVHSGSSSGGHYYAYIKCFKNGEWYCFNDAQVTRITYDDIQKTYGGGPSRGYYSSAYSSSSNAYMLMYRQIDKEKNAECMTPEKFPDHIKALLQRMIEQEEKERIQKELDRSTCKIKLFCQHPSSYIMKEMKLKIHKDCSLAEATQTAYTIMNLEGIVPLDCCRLVKYDEFTETLESSFDPNTEETIGELLGGVKSSYKFDLLLEIKKPHEHFQEYKPGGATIKIHVVDLEKELVLNRHIFIQCNLSDTVEDLRQKVADALGIEGWIRMVVMNYAPILLHDPSKTLEAELFNNKGDKLYVEYKDQEDANKLFVESKLYRVLDIHKNTICINFTLPKIDQATIDRLRQHNCDTTEIQDESSSEEDTKSEKDKEIYFDNLGAQLRDEITKISRKKKAETNCTNDSEDNESIVSGDTMSRFQQPHNSDQSEDSSLTDSERTLVGDEFSPRNNSPDIAEPEIEFHSDPLPLTDRDFIVKDFSVMEKYSRTTEREKKSAVLEKRSPSDASDYFHAVTYFDLETNEKSLRVYVDKRMTLANLKEKLAPSVGVESNCFKIFQVLSSQETIECTRLKDNVVPYSDETLIVKLGRALRKGEYPAKLFLLRINDSQSIKYLTDCVISKGMTVLELKQEILPELREKFDLNIPLDRCRLRCKNWTAPGLIYMDHRTFDSYSCNFNNQIFIEELTGPETMTSESQISIFTKMWHPSTYTMDPFKEITIEPTDPESFRKTLSEISQIPEEFIEFARGPGVFPSEVYLLTIDKELYWHVQSPSPSSDSYQFKMLSLTDGLVVYYRDNREELKKLSEDEKRILQNKENAKSSLKLKLSFSPRKEKALKIYTLDSNPSSVQNKSSQSTSNSSVVNESLKGSQRKKILNSTQSLCSFYPELD